VLVGGPALRLDGGDEIAVELHAGVAHHLFHGGRDRRDIGPDHMTVLDMDERRHIPRADSHLPSRGARERLVQGVTRVVEGTAAPRDPQRAAEPEREIAAERAAQHVVHRPRHRAEESRLVREAPEREDVAASALAGAPEHLAEAPRLLLLVPLQPFEEHDERAGGQRGMLHGIVPGDGQERQLGSTYRGPQPLESEVVQLHSKDGGHEPFRKLTRHGFDSEQCLSTCQAGHARGDRSAQGPD
jgi:hypothetical protein